MYKHSSVSLHKQPEFKQHKAGWSLTDPYAGHQGGGQATSETREILIDLQK